MMKIKFVAAWLAALSGSSAFAGWNSGGSGELNQDAANPWFLANTASVNYCIETFDAAVFGASRDEASAAITGAIAYWKREIGYASHPKDPMTRVATQAFVETPCAADTALRFQFGVLSAEQRAWFNAQGQSPRQLAAIAVRTDYDRVNLRAKGFVYVSPDSGALAFDLPDALPHPWARPGNLQRVLAHELGHVFGMPHIELYPFWWCLMSEAYPEAVVRGMTGHADGPIVEGFFAQHLASSAGKKVLAYRELDDGAPGIAVVDAFFDTSPQRNMALWFRAKSGPTIQVFRQPVGVISEDAEPIGEIAVVGDVEEASVQPYVKVRLNPEQRVFEDSLSYYVPRFGPGIVTTRQEGLYRSYHSGSERLVFIELGPTGLSLSGVLDGEPILDVFKGR